MFLSLFFTTMKIVRVWLSMVSKQTYFTVLVRKGLFPAYVVTFAFTRFSAIEKRTMNIRYPVK